MAARLRAGIPTLAEVAELVESDLFLEHEAFNAEFLRRAGHALGGYRRAWIADPLYHWSRRWEYPFVARRVLESDRATRILDAGSGVTYLPYYLCEKLPGAQVVCCDSKASYRGMFEAANRAVGHDRVRFETASLQRLPFESASFDAVCCVSVMEHTNPRDHEAIVRELRRVLAPAGLLAMTFDIALDGEFELLPETARRLLKTLATLLRPASDDPPWDAELERINGKDDLLTTDAIRRTQPQLLPWKYPMLQSAKDFLGGHGWTGGFRSVAAFCLSGTAVDAA